MNGFNNKPYQSRREIFLSHLLQGTYFSQLAFQLFLVVFHDSTVLASVSGIIACAFYSLFKMTWVVASDEDVYLNDERIMGIMLGCLIGEVILML